MFKQGKEYTSYDARYHCIWADDKGAVMEVVETGSRYWTEHGTISEYNEVHRISLWFNVFESASTGMPWISNTGHNSRQAAVNYAKHVCGDMKLLDTVELVWEQKQ